MGLGQTRHAVLYFKSFNKLWSGRGSDGRRPIMRGHLRNFLLKHNKSELHPRVPNRGDFQTCFWTTRPLSSSSSSFTPSSSSSSSALPLRHRTSCFIQTAERERRRWCQLASVSVSGRHARRPNARAAVTPHALPFSAEVASSHPPRSAPQRCES